MWIPRIPSELRQLIRRTAKENITWGQERIANELLLKLGLRVSPRTVRKYMPKPVPGRPRGDQRWATFLRNHVQAIIACDFLVPVTATFRMIYVFVVIHSSRRLLHLNVTTHPTAAWTLQQLRETIGFDDAFRYLLHDRDSIFSQCFDRSIEALALRILKSPPHSPKAKPLGPGLPDPPSVSASPIFKESRHRLRVPLRVNVKSVLGGLHHEYTLQPSAM